MRARMWLLWSLVAWLGAAAAHAGDAASPPSLDCIACRADAGALLTSYSEAEWEQLRAGEVITSETRDESAPGTRRSTVSASGLIEASPGQAWSVITDHAAYPSFLPTVEATRVFSRADGRLSVTQHLRILFVDVRYSTLDPARGLATWQLDESAPRDIAETSGSWQLAPLPERDVTLVRYRARVDTGRPLPGPIERLLTRSSLPRVVRSVREEVQRRYGR